MMHQHPKSVRRELLLFLYARYQKDPLEMLAPEDFLEADVVSREELVPNAFYLHDRGLIELMMGYNPPLFAAARITADGIDLVENQSEFDRRFPPKVGQLEAAVAEIPAILEKLADEAEFSPIDGEQRKCLLRDIQYLRGELARPARRWRTNVLDTVLEWIEQHIEGDPAEILPSLDVLRQAIAVKLK